MRPLVIRGAELLAFGAIPVVALVLALATYWDQGRLALDFHWELYPQAELVRDGEHAFDEPDSYLEDRANLIWPVAAVLPVVPLTVVGPDAADWIATAFVLATLVATLFVVGVRDWRIYGLSLMFPSVLDAVQTANASIPIALLVALAWKYRDRWAVAGAAIGFGIAVKFFVWPLLVWLVAIRRARAAVLAAAIAGASVLLMVPFTDVADYARLISKLRRTFEHQSYTMFAVLTDMGVPDVAARGLTVAAGAAVLYLAWRRRSLNLAIAAALLLSPVVWRHFFVLLLVPLGISRQRLDILWFLPLGMWLGDGTFNGATWQTVVVLAIGATIVIACERRPSSERQAATVSRIPASAPI
jgi:glycosyl transferase family 87